MNSGRLPYAALTSVIYADVHVTGAIPDIVVFFLVSHGISAIL